MGYVLFEISFPREHTFGLISDGSVACWGDNEDGQTTPPEGRHISSKCGFLLVFRGEDRCATHLVGERLTL